MAKAVKNDRYALCPCDGKTFYRNCCRRFHDGERPVTALLLMRSRYLAYALDLADYIIETTDPDNREHDRALAEWRNDVHNFSRETHFLFLEILDFQDGTETAFVSFIAHLRRAGEDATFSERSTFQKRDGRWFYRGAEIRDA